MSNGRILLVEDDDATAELERRVLVRAGMTVHAVTRVADAVAILREREFDAVLLDYQLPDGDPWAVLEAANTKVPRIPVIIVTAMGNERVAAEALHRGVAEYVKKSDVFWDQLPGVVDRVARSAHAEEELRRSEALVKLISEHASDVVLRLGPDGVVRYVSPAIHGLLGYQPDQLVGRPLLELAHPDDRAEIARLVATLETDDRARIVARRQRRDGGYLWVESSLCVVRGPDGSVEEMLALWRDVSERRAAQDALQREQAKLAEAQRLAHLGSWDWDIAADRISWSAELYRIFGVEPAAFSTTYQAYLERLHPDDRARVEAHVQAAYQDGQPFAFEHRIVRPNGEVRVIASRGEVTLDASGQVARMAGTAHDVTEQRAVEAKLMLADRMASLGTLAAGIGHEINNPLACVIGNQDHLVELVAQLAGMIGPARQAELDESLADARAGADRVRRIVRGLRTFARADLETRVVVELPAVLDLAAQMTHNELRHRARLVKAFGPCPAVHADEARLAQVFINLLVNAAHAIPEGHADEHEIRLVTRTDPAGRAVVEVRDTGAGIAAEARGRIFDPFFTTKPIGAGTGLGLSICHGIVAELGGEIEVDSAPERGTVFRVILPPAGARDEVAGAATVPAAATVAQVAAERRARVLVIDDEPKVALTYRRLLKATYDVVVVDSGRAGLDALSAGTPFDVILCDLMMPDMTGMELHEVLARRDPGQLAHLIFMTGGAFTPAAEAFLARVDTPRLLKPIAADELRAAVRARLA